MSSQNPWSVLAIFAEELAPAAQTALDAVALVAHAVVRADERSIGAEVVTLTPSNQENDAE